MKRSKYSLSHYKLATFDMGELVPIGWYEALPGDTVQQSTSALLRVSPLVAPVMHPVSVRIHHWFVPNRLLWDDWEDFITGGPSGADNTTPPYVDMNALSVNKGTLLDYLGVPTMNYTGTGLRISALPARAYALIYNEFYRDQDLATEAPLSTASGADTITTGAVRKVSWEKDIFTTARPWPQKGPDVTLPLGTRAPVQGIGTKTSVFGAQAAPRFPAQGLPGADGIWSHEKLIGVASNDQETYIKGTGADGRPDIYADLSLATAVNVNDVRRVFALQRYAEARAQYGSRYTEYLRYLGVRSSDARLQRPEYLGGGKQTIAFSEVLRTGGADAEGPIGELKGHGISAMRSRRYRRFFEEHGIVMSLMSVRPRTMYVQGLHRGWLRTTREDYWQRELELIGQQEVNSREVFASSAATSVFGFQDRYYEYRHMPSSVAGDFRDTLDYWHMARIFSTAPVLNQSFIECDPTKRIHAVQTNDVLWAMCGHNIQARRMVTSRTIGRII